MKSNLNKLTDYLELKNEKTKYMTDIIGNKEILILSRTKSKEKREFYLKLAIKESYSKVELNRQIDSQYYLRYEANKNALPSTIKAIDEDDYPNTKKLDLYSLKFFDLPNKYSEKNLRKSIMNNSNFRVVYMVFDYII